MEMSHLRTAALESRGTLIDQGRPSEQHLDAVLAPLPKRCVQRARRLTGAASARPRCASSTSTVLE
jgi:hypothetical protein